MLLPRLRETRKKAELSVEELAVKVFMTKRAIDYIESGRGTTLNTMKRLAKVLKCKGEDLK